MTLVVPFLCLKTFWNTPGSANSCNMTPNYLSRLSPHYTAPCHPSPTGACPFTYLSSLLLLPAPPHLILRVEGLSPHSASPSPYHFWPCFRYFSCADLSSWFAFHPFSGSVFSDLLSETKISRRAETLHHSLGGPSHI